MLPFKVSAAQYAAMSDEIKSHYKLSGDSYVLETLGDHPQVAGLQSQLARAGVDLANANQRNVELSGQITVLEQSAEAKYKDDLDATKKKLDTLQNTVKTDRETAEINAIASRFTNSELFTGTLQNRIKAEVNKDGAISIKYYNKDGAEVERQVLHDEFLKNAAYAGMLKKEGAPSVNGTPPTNPASSPTTTSTTKPQGGNDAPTWHKDESGQYHVDMSRISDQDLAAAIKAQHAESQQA